MILGMSTSTFTLVHVVLSLVGIFAGLVVLIGMFSSKRLDGWTALFRQCRLRPDAYLFQC